MSQKHLRSFLFSFIYFWVYAPFLLINWDEINMMTQFILFFASTSFINEVALASQN